MADARLQVDASGARHLADDVVARVIVAMGGDARGAAGDERERGYAACVSDNRRRVRQALDPDAESLPPPPAARPARYDEAVAGAVAHLSLDLREALLAVALGGFSHAEAARVLDLPLATVTARLIRARRAMTTALRGAEGDGPRAPRAPPRLRLVK
ncbi:MAG: hypothetical protein KGQ28_08370 [Hyphomicrobiales bacterium]|nr:hypothetical protein [Hyphomicrobiales bacterium]